MNIVPRIAPIALRIPIGFWILAALAESIALSAPPAMMLRPFEPGRLQLEIQSDHPATFEISMSTNLTEWRPFLMAPTSEDLLVQLEVPTNACGQSFFRALSSQDTVRPLKTMAFIPGGTFLMGQEEPYASALGLPVSGPVHLVTLDPFQMDTHEVSLAEWNSVKTWAVDRDRGDNAYDFRNNGGAVGPTHPVVVIDWFDTVKWANARSEMEGLKPVYYTDPGLSNVYRKGIVEILNQTVDWDGEGYRLPTEAEWEYAARGGLVLKIFPWGDEYPRATQVNFAYLYDTATEPGRFPPNAYGLFDMAGNVREWCWDLHKDDPSITYTNHRVFAPYDPWPQTNPHGPDTGPRGMSRGGSFVDTQHYIQCGRRHNDERDRLTVFTGFRLVRREPEESD